MKFCSECGSPNVRSRIPEGDNRARYICEECQRVFYQNPKIVAGCILKWDDRILLCKRSIQPRLGYWTIPAGFMEKSESVVEAAARESWEEASARSEAMVLHSIYTLKHVDQVYIVYRAQLKDGKAKADRETSETMLFDQQSIPWDHIAFPIVKHSLELYFEDRANERFQLHQGEILLDGNGCLHIIDYADVCMQN